MSVQTTCQKTKNVGIDITKIKTAVTGSGFVLPKPVKPQLFALFANAKLAKLVLLGRKRQNYLRLKMSQITQCLILFRYSA